ncbi:hypothetical protein PG997_015304 [Apiospora hydei]|uniref:Uncharacterized protein n=1 Tax=Apiospora hydei TaxID=1337664 RepID=A0ABR1UTE8_9PEZI
MILHLWEWAASHVTNWVNYASSASGTSLVSDTATSHHNQNHSIPSLLRLRKRESSQDLDTTIGVVVGVLVGVFVLGTLAFCYAYRNTIRFKRKQKFRRQRRRHTSGAPTAPRAPRVPGALQVAQVVTAAAVMLRRHLHRQHRQHRLKGVDYSTRPSTHEAPERRHKNRRWL